MSTLDLLISEYEIEAPTFDVAVPVSSGAVTFVFRSFRSPKESAALTAQSRKLAEKCPLAGTKITSGPFKDIEDRLPATAEDARRIAQMSAALVEPTEISFVALVRLCANPNLFEYLWGCFQAGNRTVYSRLVDAAIQEAKKNSEDPGDSSSEPSETSASPSRSGPSTRRTKKNSSGS